MKFTEVFIGEIKEQIKLQIKKNPFVTVQDLTDHLRTAYKHNFKWDTVQKYVKDIRKERIEKIKRTSAEEYIASLAEMIETHNDIRHSIYKSVSTEPKDRLKAMKDAEKSVEAIADLAMDFGLHKRDLGELTVDSPNEEEAEKIEQFLAGFGIKKLNNNLENNGSNSNQEETKKPKAKTKVSPKKGAIRKGKATGLVQGKALRIAKARKRNKN